MCVWYWFNCECKMWTRDYGLWRECMVFSSALDWVAFNRAVKDFFDRNTLNHFNADLNLYIQCLLICF